MHIMIIAVPKALPSIRSRLKPSIHAAGLRLSRRSKISMMHTAAAMITAQGLKHRSDTGEQPWKTADSSLKYTETSALAVCVFQ